MNQIQTDPRTGRRYQVGPDGVSRWLDEQPVPPQPRLDPAGKFGPAQQPHPQPHPQPRPQYGTPGPTPAGRRRKGLVIGLVAAVVIGVMVLGVAIWAWPTTAGCESQVDAEVVKALQSKDITEFQPNTDQSHYWRCFGQSDQAMQEITARVMARHTGELVQKGISDLLG